MAKTSDALKILDNMSRLMDEYEQLRARLVQITRFCRSAKLRKLELKDQFLLLQQQNCMRDYADVLKQRILRLRQKHGAKKEKHV